MQSSSLLYQLQPPAALKVSGTGTSEHWTRFKEQWENYETATGLSEKSQEMRAAFILTIIGNDAYDVFRTMTFDPAENRKQIDHIVAAFDAYCKAAVNVTYKRYVFYKRLQGPTETFDIFYADVRRLAATCAFETVADSMIKDRLVVSIYDDATVRSSCRSANSHSNGSLICAERAKRRVNNCE
jgi:hypothetical protein